MCLLFCHYFNNNMNITQKSAYLTLSMVPFSTVLVEHKDFLIHERILENNW